jgi:hypothetical protein
VPVPRTVFPPGPASERQVRPVFRETPRPGGAESQQAAAVFATGHPLYRDARPTDLWKFSDFADSDGQTDSGVRGSWRRKSSTANESGVMGCWGIGVLGYWRRVPHFSTTPIPRCALQFAARPGTDPAHGKRSSLGIGTRPRLWNRRKALPGSVIGEYVPAKRPCQAEQVAITFFNRRLVGF